MADIGKLLIFVGIVCLVVGAIMLLSGRLPWLGKLPGDILIRKDGFSLYIPLATCLLLGVIISILINFWSGK